MVLIEYGSGKMQRKKVFFIGVIICIIIIFALNFLVCKPKTDENLFINFLIVAPKSNISDNYTFVVVLGNVTQIDEVPGSVSFAIKESVTYPFEVYIPNYRFINSSNCLSGSLSVKPPNDNLEIVIDRDAQNYCTIQPFEESSRTYKYEIIANGIDGLATISIRVYRVVP
ncbi:MAG: hypothetical protein AB1665_06435 [Candidatus Thermoplasmatota archaeon]